MYINLEMINENKKTTSHELSQSFIYINFAMKQTNILPSNNS
jgi:hypothetical protein